MIFSDLLTSPLEWILFFLCAILIGMSKTGIQGIGTLTLPVLAYLFGAKNSTGILLPIICFADLMAILYYRTNLNLKNVLKLLPWTLVGLAIAVVVGNAVPTQFFKGLMAFCVFLGLAIMLWSEHKGKNTDSITTAFWYAPLFGLMVGFATMIGNAAGPILSVYLLSMRLPKYAFVSTGAWFIMIVNYIKVPLQVFAWDNITWNVFLLDLLTIPFLALGAFMGVRLVKYLPETLFRKVMIYLTVLAAIMLLI